MIRSASALSGLYDLNCPLQASQNPTKGAFWVTICRLGIVHGILLHAPIRRKHPKLGHKSISVMAIFRQLSADGGLLLHRIDGCVSQSLRNQALGFDRFGNETASGQSDTEDKHGPKNRMLCGPIDQCATPYNTKPITIKSATSGWRNIVPETLVPVGVDTKRPRPKARTNCAPECL